MMDNVVFSSGGISDFGFRDLIKIKSKGLESRLFVRSYRRSKAARFLRAINRPLLVRFISDVTGPITTWNSRFRANILDQSLGSNRRNYEVRGISGDTGPRQNHCRRLWRRIDLQFRAGFRGFAGISRQLINLRSSLSDEGDHPLPSRRRARCFDRVPSIIVGGAIPLVVQAVASSVMVVTW